MKSVELAVSVPLISTKSTPANDVAVPVGAGVVASAKARLLGIFEEREKTWREARDRAPLDQTVRRPMAASARHPGSR